MDTLTPLDIELLGRIAVRLGDAELTLRGELPRALLARLALAAGEPVPGELLVRELWADPPETAAVAVRGNISKLRQAGLDPYLHGGRGGYRLDVDSERVDLLRLRRAVQEVRTVVTEATGGGRIADLEGVAGLLWSGEALPELEDQPFAVRVRAELAEERRFAGQELIAALIERGDHQRALAGAGMLVAEHPLADEPVRLEALALAGVGRSSEALAAIDRYAERLAGELGLELPPALAELRLQVLRADPLVGPRADGRQVERHGIPLPLTRFVGRGRELAELVDARSRSRLVTLVGPGGVGKSRLAVESARRAGTDVDDEQWMVDLAVVPEGGDVLGAVAEAVGASERTAEAVIRRLAGRRALVVLDNAEHVLDPARLAARRLLEGCEGLCVLVTSREALRIPGERVVTVPPFVGADAEAAVELFAARAADARAGFVVDGANLAAVESLCAALDGMPLALELAAARLDVMELGHLADSMLGPVGRSPEPAALAAVGGAPDAADAPVQRAARRHSSLVDAIGWSIALLDEGELALLARLARFAGTFDFADVAAVCRPADGEPAGDPVALAVQLAQQSLIAVVDREGRTRRYRVLESVKAFVLARHPLDDRETLAWAERHAAWFAELADRLDPELRGSAKHEARDRLDQASPDLQLALDHAVAAGDRATALRIAAGQAEHWMRKGTLAAGKQALDRALAVPGAAAAPIEARALVGAALLTYQAGGYEEALAYADRAFVAASEAGDTDRQALLLGYAAYGRSLFGDTETAEALATQATALAGQAQPWVQASVLFCLGQSLRALGKPAQALETLQRAKTIAVRIGYAWIATSATYVTGKVLVDVRRGQDAIDVLLPGVAFALADEDPTGALALLHLVGGASALIERQATGAAIFAAVDRLGARYDYNPVIAEGDDARVHRERVAIALSTEEQARAAAEGAALELDALFALASTLGRKRKGVERAAA